MRVTVLLFAELREQLGMSSVSIEVEVDATVADVVAALAARHEVLYERRFSTALNRRYAAGTTAVADGDELALIPPVSGG